MMMLVFGHTCHAAAAAPHAAWLPAIAFYLLIFFATRRHRADERATRAMFYEATRTPFRHGHAPQIRASAPLLRDDAADALLRC